MSTAKEAPETDQTTKIKPSGAKRGRKRKSEISIQELEYVLDTAPREKTVSRRGRPRKKVNYYELANPENLDFPIQLEQEIKYFNTENEDTKNNIKKKILEKDTVETPESSNHSDKASVSLQDGDEILNSNNSNGKLEDTTPLSEPKSSHEGENGTAAQDLSVIEDSNTSFEATTSTPIQKDKRYNYTGDTVKMMNTLFNFFTSKPSDKAGDDSNCNSTNNTSDGNNSLLINSSNNTKRPYRKTKKFQKTLKEEDLEDGSGHVTCAICNTTMDKNMWSHHKQRYHNNLAWRVGDPPLDLNDQSFVMHTLNTLYKKKKPLYCDKCGEVKKSVVGFLSHRSQCLKSEEQLESVKIACEICGRKMLPVSMTTHMKMFHLNPTEKEEVLPKGSNEIKPLTTKRSAAKKAMKIIENATKNDEKDQYFTSNLDLGSQEFAKQLLQNELNQTQFIECKFKCNCITTNMEDALKHMEECTEKPDEAFVCKQCLLILTKLEDIIYHIEFTHDISIAVDEDDDLNEKEIAKMPSFVNTIIRRTERVLFPFAFDWTYKFHMEHFSDHLFEELPFSESNWPLLPSDLVGQYLPTMNESCDVARRRIVSFINPLSEHYSFKKYKLFESEVHEDHKITLFCGGPISSMAWLPTPYTKEDNNQLLAVSVLNSPDEKYETYQNFKVSSAIQFWNFGPLVNKIASMTQPKLAFGLAHDHGPVWHMEWCPSGCYDFKEEGSSRMGILAVTGSDSIVYIYSVPFFSEETGLYYKAKPVMKLFLQRPGSALLGGLKYFPTKISWSKASGHIYVAVGYTNGFVALFNVKNSSLMLKFKDADGTPCILPKKCFQAHSHAITALTLFYLNGGCRWLLTGSYDRGVSLWDLDNRSYPICTLKKNIVTDGFWLTNWLCYVTASDEGSTSLHVTTMLKQARDYIYDPNVTLTCSQATISSTAGSDWLNGVIHGNVVGELVAIFPHQMLQIPEHQKILKTKRLLFGYTCLLEKDKSPAERVKDHKIRKKTLENLLTKKVSAGIKMSKIKSDFDCNNLFVNEPIMYKEAEERYALLFCDNRMKSYEDFPKTTAKELTALSKSYGITQANQYPLTTVNKIVFNPNRQASLYYATGYQCGLVRISWMEFLKNDQQIK